MKNLQKLLLENNVNTITIVPSNSRLDCLYINKNAEKYDHIILSIDDRKYMEDFGTSYPGIYQIILEPNIDINVLRKITINSYGKKRTFEIMVKCNDIVKLFKAFKSFYKFNKKYIFQYVINNDGNANALWLQTVLIDFINGSITIDELEEFIQNQQ